ncbi:hypothetical protein BKA62DRAFT_718053 [Auriculariales sp. MPI-PUGE-AT-0066]|nr:hypothetical protein BKA62DRAFT_718053 [Auriculariales sp. MPI-PUGE-AT-0066]
MSDLKPEDQRNAPPLFADDGRLICTLCDGPMTKHMSRTDYSYGRHFWCCTPPEGSGLAQCNNMFIWDAGVQLARRELAIVDPEEGGIEQLVPVASVSRTPQRLRPNQSQPINLPSHVQPQAAELPTKTTPLRPNLSAPTTTSQQHLDFDSPETETGPLPTSPLKRKGKSRRRDRPEATLMDLNESDSDEPQTPGTPIEFKGFGPIPPPPSTVASSQKGTSSVSGGSDDTEGDDDGIDDGSRAPLRTVASHSSIATSLATLLRRPQSPLSFMTLPTDTPTIITAASSEAAGDGGETEDVFRTPPQSVAGRSSISASTIRLSMPTTIPVPSAQNILEMASSMETVMLPWIRQHATVAAELTALREQNAALREENARLRRRRDPDGVAPMIAALQEEISELQAKAVGQEEYIQYLRDLTDSSASADQWVPRFQ